MRKESPMIIKRTKFIAILLASLAILLILAGCANTSEAEQRAAEAEGALENAQAEIAALQEELDQAQQAAETAGEEATEAPTPEEEMTEEAPAEEEAGPTEFDPEAYDCSDMSVATIVHWQGPYTQLLIDGSQVAADECGAEFQSAGPAGIDPPQHFSIFQDVIATEPNAVVTVAYPADLWVRVIDDTVNAGIPVSTVDVASPTSLESVHAGPRQKDLGIALANIVIDQLGEDAEGQVVGGLCFPALDVIAVRFNGFTETFNERAPNVEVVGPLDVTFDQAENFARWQEIINTYPDALAYVGFCENDLPNLIRIKEDDPSAEYEIASIGVNPDALAGIASGVGLGVVGQKPFLQGYVAMRAMLQDMVFGGDTPRGWIDTGPEVVTIDNVEEITAREEAGSEAYREFYADQIDEIFSDLPGHVQSFGDYIAE
jgi:ABC-type sugar transport system substrate-binding protein/outer membrane murein-binding lipoprotein Lpp